MRDSWVVLQAGQYEMREEGSSSGGVYRTMSTVVPLCPALGYVLSFQICYRVGFTSAMYV
jgi:hypothetical protein